MKIKDVEKLTGLTAKSIRYYESKNLIAVERNKDNAYRNYTDADVARLRWIKLLRYLDFSIEEIEKLLSMGAGELKDTMREKAGAFSEQEDTCEKKRRLCLIVADEYNESFPEEYSDAVEFLESDEMRAFVEQAEELSAPNLVTTIAGTLIFSAPVFWLFYNINAARTGLLMMNAVFAIIGTALTTWSWIHYANYYKKHKIRVKKRTRKMAWLIPALLAAVILGIVTVVALMVLVSKLIVPDGYLFFEHGPIAEKVMVMVLMVPVILFCILAVTKIRRKPAGDMEDVSDLLFIWNHLGRWRTAVIAVWLFALYLCAFSFTAVTENSIICYSPWTPLGVEYGYSDVDSIKTGFGDENISFAEYKRAGSFYYQIKIDGRTVTFHTPSTNDEIERYEEHTYLELEEFDRALVRLGIPKEASEKGWENCDFDEEYVDRFLRIIANRSEKITS